MELNWSTFILEIINFLVLVWILKRFLYQPVLDVIARRRAGIDRKLADAETRHADAERLRQQYEGRLADWDRERQQAREDLSRELEAERARRLSALRETLDQERETARVAAARREADSRRRLEESALALGARFCTRLLEQSSGPELEARLVDLLCSGLEQLPEERATALRNSAGRNPASITVLSAYPLPEAQRGRLERLLTDVTGLQLPLRFEQERALLAGVHITIGDRVLAANVRDELAAFTELAHDG